MKLIIKLEELGLLDLSLVAYYYYFPSHYLMFLYLFFLPDISFITILISKKVAAISYNIFHHKGLISLLILAGLYCKITLVIQLGIVFMAHSCFDRLMGYGLKHFDNFDHTHLGWIGKSKHKNEQTN